VTGLKATNNQSTISKQLTVAKKYINYLHNLIIWIHFYLVNSLCMMI